MNSVTNTWMIISKNETPDLQLFIKHNTYDYIAVMILGPRLETEMKTWLKDNIDDYHHDEAEMYVYICFKNENDIALFKLRWG